MAEAKVADGTGGAGRRLASVSVSLGGAAPGDLLRLGEGGPRGFWAREGRWFAHLGETARVEVMSASDGPGRFRAVQREARRLLSGSWPVPRNEVTPPAPRLFGGFSFREDHEASGLWEGFPSACFLLPEWELMGGEGEAVLTLRVLLSPGEDPERAREDLRSRLRALVARLGAPSPQAPSRPAPSQQDPHLDRPSLAERSRPAPPLQDGRVPSAPSDQDWASWSGVVERALAAVTAGEMAKVVLARVESAFSEGGGDAVEVALALWRENPGSHVFLFEPLPGRVLVGAAPETVATVAGGAFRATAVAGSVGRGSSEEEREALARSLLGSRKDLMEHRICVDDMVRRLSSLSEEVRAQEHPRVLTLPAIQHLETVVEARLGPGETVLSALEALHPTPAVCGLPRDRALEFLRREEPFQRGWYAGPVGWVDGEGDGVFVPALRSAVGDGREWTLFAGAGIVEGSDPMKEWEETRIKLQPVLRALAAAGDPPARTGT